MSHLCDHLGSVIALATPDGEIVESYEYEPYGMPTIYDDEGEIVTSRTSSVGDRFMFTGREWDELGEFCHYRHRTYSPHEERFMQRDPIGLAGGWNVYAYCGGDPVNASDPMGLSAKVWWNQFTWLDSDGSERLFDPRTWFTTGGPDQGQALWGGMKDGYIGWSNCYLNTTSLGHITNYADKCNSHQALASALGNVSAMALQVALSASATKAYSAWRSAQLPNQLHHHTTTGGFFGILSDGGVVSSVRSTAIAMWGEGAYFTSLRHLNPLGKILTGVGNSDAVIGFSQAMTQGRLTWVAPFIYRTGSTSGVQGAIAPFIYSLWKTDTSGCSDP